MRYIDTIAVHCSATRPDLDWGVDELRRIHVDDNGWSDVGYHEIIRRSGIIEFGRPYERLGAHVRGHNKTSIAIVLIGGVDINGDADANFTLPQYIMLEARVNYLKRRFPTIQFVKGHREFSPDIDGDGTIDANERIKECPCFNVEELLKRCA